MMRTGLLLVMLAVLAAMPVLSGLLGNPYLLSLATRAAILAIAAVGLQFVVGYAGLVSFGHAAFLGIGAYALLILDGHAMGRAAVSLPVAMLAAALFALVTGWAALRTQGVTFIMVTLAFAQMAYFVVGALADYGGDDGMNLADAPLPLGRVGFHWLTVALLAAVLCLSLLVGQSRFGRALRAARENATRVAALGFDVRRVRLLAYVGSGAVTGLAGWLMATQTEFVSPALLDWRMSGELLAMVILGGVAGPQGAVLGAVFLLLAQEALAAQTEHWRIILGPAIILFVLLRPKAAR